MLTHTMHNAQSLSMQNDPGSCIGLSPPKTLPQKAHPACSNLCQLQKCQTYMLMKALGNNIVHRIS